METIYNARRQPIAKKTQSGKYTYLNTCTGKVIAIYDSYCDKTFDANRRFVGTGDILDRFIPQ